MKIISIALLAALLLSLVPAPARAQSPCQNTITRGDWEGTTHERFEYRLVIPAEGLPQDTVFEGILVTDGTLQFTVDGCTVTNASWHTHINDGWQRWQWAWGPIEECTYSSFTDLTQGAGTVVTGPGGLPELDITFPNSHITILSAEGDCGDDPGSLPPLTYQFQLTGAEDTGARTISGIWYMELNGVIGDTRRLAEEYVRQGAEVLFDQAFNLTRKRQPTVKGLNPELRQHFLRGIAVTNRYTSAIDWDGGDPGAASFILGGGAPQPMVPSPAGATYDLAVGGIDRSGVIPITIQAEIDGKSDQRSGQDSITMVEPPTWSNPFHLSAQKKGDHVLYKGELKLPEEPLDAHVSIPPLIPYVGGDWGVLPSQIKVGLTANSLGVRERDQVSAQGGFGLGSRKFTLSARGNVYSTLTSSDLRFESEQATLSTSGVFYQERLGLVSVVPGASALFGVPVIGNLLQALNAAIAISGNVQGSLAGRGRLGVRGERLELTEGGFNAGLGVHASAGINTLVAWAQVQGGGEGALDMDLVPNTKVNTCQILLYFQAGAGAFGYQAGPIVARHPLLSCTGATAGAPLAAASPLSVAMHYGPPGPLPAERAVLHPKSSPDPGETVLAEHVSLQARPQLAIGPGERLAIVWNSLSPRGAADAVSLRLYDGTAWGPPVVISPVDRPSFDPALAFDGDGNLIVVWAEAGAEPDPDALTAAFARSLDIVWAQVDGDTAALLARGQLTDDDILDFGPRLSAAADGVVWLAWQQSPAATLVGTGAAPNHLLAAAWDGASWSASETAASTWTGNLFWEIAAANANHAWIAGDQDKDGDLSTANDREIVSIQRTASGWAALRPLGDDPVLDTAPLLTLTPEGAPLIAWLHGDEVLGIEGDPATAAPRVWFDAGAGVGPMLGSGRLLAGEEGELILLWPEGTEQGQDIWLSRYSPAAGTWSQPAPIFESADQRHSLTARRLPGGEIVLGLVAAAIEAQSVDFEGAGAVTVPGVAASGRLIVVRLPAGYLPPGQQAHLFLPYIEH